MLAVVTALAVMGRAWMAARAQSLAAKPEPAAPAAVHVVTLAPEVVSTGLRYSAAVKEFEKTELSFRIGGTVEALHRVAGPDGRLRNVHEGDRIPKGTALARLDPADYRRDRDVSAEKLATAQARLAQLDSDAELAKLELRRSEQLMRRGAGTASELDTKRARLLSTAATVAGARRDLESARISLEQAEANLSYCTLASPFEVGTVAARDIDAGQRVGANQRAFLVYDLSRVVIAFVVPDTLVGRLSLGQELEVNADALPGELFRGVVHKIGSVADPRTRTYDVEVRIDESKGLRPGMIATVLLRRETRASLVPLTAVIPRPGTRLYDVFRVVEAEGRTVVRRVPVEFDDVADNRIAVKFRDGAALKPGDRVVAIGVHRLHDGQPVRVEQ